MCNEQTIWSYLLQKIGNPYGVAGLMGNLYAESGLKPKNMQNSYESKLGLTDDTYTAAVDAGTYTNFVKDAVGYGLAQWTYHSRKQNLLNFVKNKGVSIGNLEAQLEFLMQELSTGYSGVLKILKNATSVRQASDVVLTQFERPADQGETVKQKRASYGQKYYDDYAGTASSGITSSGTTSSGTSAPTYTVGKNYTLQVELKVRSGAGTNYAAKKYSQLTVSGKKHDKDGDGALDKGTVVTCKEVKTNGSDIWLRCPSGWLAAYYQGNVYIK